MRDLSYGVHVAFDVLLLRLTEAVFLTRKLAEGEASTEAVDERRRAFTRALFTRLPPVRVSHSG